MKQPFAIGALVLLAVLVSGRRSAADDAASDLELRLYTVPSLTWWNPVFRGERGPHPVSREDLFRMVEGVENPGLSRALDVMLNRLKKALPKELAERIVNVKNFGYCFLEDRRVTKP